MKRQLAVISGFFVNIKNNLKSFIKKTEEKTCSNIMNEREEFKCHICSVPGITETIPYDSRDNIPFNNLWSLSPYPIICFRIPVNLTRCNICSQWTCDKHLNNHGICQTCESKSKRGD